MMISRPQALRYGAAALCLLSLVLLAVPLLTGSTKIVVSAGSSMEPGVSEGDLIVVRKQAKYDVGDVVAYDNIDLGTVLHRIVEAKPTADGTRFVMQGDNNDFLDSDEPLASAVFGESVLTLSGVGKYLGYLPIAAVAALAAYWFYSSSAGQPAPWSAGRRMQGRTLVGIGLLVVYGVLGLVATFTSTSSARSRTVPYEVGVEVGWTADVQPSVVYPEGQVDPTGPIFLSEIDQVQIWAEVSSPLESTDSRADAAMTVTVSDSSGWSSEIDLLDLQVATEDPLIISGTLDVPSLRVLLDEVATRTGHFARQFDLAIGVTGSMVGEVNGRPFESQIDHHVSLVLDDIKLQADPDALWAVPVPGTVEITETVEKSVGVGPVKVSVSLLRILGPLGAVIGLIMMSSTKEEAETHDLINQHFSGYLMSVSALALPADATMVDVDGFEDLLRMAQIEGSPILDIEGDVHEWMTFALGIWYRFSLNQAELTPARPDRELVEV